MSFFLAPIWEAFIELHNRRQIGYTMSPISVTAIKDWLEIRGFRDPEIKEFLYNLICRLDDTWRKLTKPKKTKKKMPNLLKEN